MIKTTMGDPPRQEKVSEIKSILFADLMNSFDHYSVSLNFVE